ncbi:MAG: hypothetical protein HDT28_01640 [Clostridiales bacterium]|nr:hypothetical protein [Clostridiales bacterium]
MKDAALTEKMRTKIKEFIDVCKANDKMDGTRTVDTAIELYSRGLGVSLQDIRKKTNMSDASLYRFRIKMADKLKAYLMENSTPV